LLDSLAPLPAVSPTPLLALVAFYGCSPTTHPFPRITRLNAVGHYIYCRTGLFRRLRGLTFCVPHLLPSPSPVGFALVPAYPTGVQLVGSGYRISLQRLYPTRFSYYVATLTQVPHVFPFCTARSRAVASVDYVFCLQFCPSWFWLVYTVLRCPMVTVCRCRYLPAHTTTFLLHLMLLPTSPRMPSTYLPFGSAPLRSVDSAHAWLFWFTCVISSLPNGVLHLFLSLFVVWFHCCTLPLRLPFRYYCLPKFYPFFWTFVILQSLFVGSLPSGLAEPYTFPFHFRCCRVGCCWLIVGFSPSLHRVYLPTLYVPVRFIPLGCLDPLDTVAVVCYDFTLLFPTVRSRLNVRLRDADAFCSLYTFLRFVPPVCRYRAG
jgi:hypothetical protein